MKVRVSHDFCMGCGPCEQICPKVFKIENNRCRVLVDHVPPEDEEKCYQAMVQCPVEAIRIESDFV